jgi:glycosyltransferase involved in cell wall biosynthesis
VESQSFDLVHFPTQRGYITSLPTIYQPWDLQHLHYPEFFTKVDIAVREHMYRALCTCARVVCVQTEWSKSDIVEKYGVPPEKIEVIKWGCALEAYEAPSADDVRAAIRKFDLPDQFFFYPAVTWPHKNHQVVLRALGYLRDQHQRSVKVVFTGAPGSHHGQLNALAQDLGISGQVSHHGFVTEKELQVIYKQSTALVFPSKFEGFGLPILEAFKTGTPVVAANASVLPEIAQEAALYFDPDSPEELGLTMLRLLDSQSLRQDCIHAGARVLNQFSIRDTVSRFQKLYRRIARNHWAEAESSNVAPERD